MKGVPANYPLTCQLPGAYGFLGEKEEVGRRDGVGLCSGQDSKVDQSIVEWETNVP